tara:strand:- start:2590 stop:3543 length:954 start_codon:yes stop_codon:yes gene_type:complete
MMKYAAIITGSNGQDGKYLFTFLQGRGYNVCKYHGDVLDKERLKDVIKQYSDTDRIEIYNLAAKVNVGISIPNPIETFHVNSIGILTILESVRELELVNKCRIFQASSSEIFDKACPEQGMINYQNEDSIKDPQTIYGISKLAADNIVKMYRQVHGIHVSSGILFNHESPLRKDNFVTSKIIKGLKRIYKGEIDYIELGNINAYKDWGHAKDYVYAMWLILQNEQANDYVIATGKHNSVRTFIETTLDVMCKKIKWEGENEDEIGIVDGKTIIKISKQFYRPDDDKIIIGNPYKLKEKTGWKPVYNLRKLIIDMLGH